MVLVVGSNFLSLRSLFAFLTLLCPARLSSYTGTHSCYWALCRTFSTTGECPCSTPPPPTTTVTVQPVIPAPVAQVPPQPPLQAPAQHALPSVPVRKAHVSEAISAILKSLTLPARLKRNKEIENQNPFVTLKIPWPTLSRMQPYDHLPVG